MKIAIVVPGFSKSEQDWCIPALLDYVRILAARAEVHVFTLRWPEWNGLYSVYGATVHAMGGRKQIGMGGALRLYARTVQKITIEHERAPFSVIHAFWADEPGWVAAWAARRLNIPLVISLAGGELAGIRDIQYGLQLLPGRDLLIRMGLSSAKWITAGSNYLLDIAKRHLGSAAQQKLVLAPLGVDIGRFCPIVGEGRRETVLNVGSLYPVKGQNMIIRAVSMVPDAQLEIAGEGPLLSGLQDAASVLQMADRVKFLGETAHDEMPELFRSAALLLQGSLYESQGMAVLEAAACGVVGIGTRVGVLPEIGIAVADDREMAWQIDRLLRDEQHRKMLGDAARETVVQRFSLELSLERFLSLYSQ